MIRDYMINGTLVMAIQVTPETITQAELFSSGQQVLEIDPIDRNITYVGVNVPTMDGVKRASEGDWIVKELGGQISVVRKHVFQRCYEAA